MRLEFGKALFSNNGQYTPALLKGGYNYQNPLGFNRTTVRKRSSLVFQAKLPDKDAYLVALRSSVWRFDPVSLQWLEVGSSIHDLTVRGIDSSGLYNSQSQLSIGQQGGTAPQCGDSLISLFADQALISNSLNSNGDQFWLLSGANQVLPIIGAKWMTANQIELQCLIPLDSNQSYFLRIRTGLSNGQQLESACGYSFANDTLRFSTGKCQELSLKELKPEVHFYPNPIKGTLHAKGFSPGSTLVVYNLQGQKVWEQHAEEKIHLDLGSGVYILILQSASSESLFQEKLLVQ